MNILRVGIINFHFAYNYGAVLECYALQETLSKMGHKVQVIDYRPDYMEQQFVVAPNPIKFAKWAAGDYRNASTVYKIYRMARRVCQCFYRYLSICDRIKRKNGFESFINNLYLTKIQYKTIEDLQKCPPECDVYISGSDQIWNPIVTGGNIDEAYFLNFGTKKTVRIGYAVSPCQLDVSKYSDDLCKLISKYAALSLREEEKLYELSRLTDKRIEICADPTLLLRKEEYERIEKQPHQICENYAVVYGFPDKESNALMYVCNYMTNHLRLATYDISTEDLKNNKDTIRVRNASPEEFIYYIHHAKYIITNSFHATVFSIIFKKEFIVVKKSGTNSRLAEMLSKCGLGSRIIEEKNEEQLKEVFSRPVAFDDATRYIEKIREDSLGFLNTHLVLSK